MHMLDQDHIFYVDSNSTFNQMFIWTKWAIVSKLQPHNNEQKSNYGYWL
jgi:hypothetical protein